MRFGRFMRMCPSVVIAIASQPCSPSLFSSSSIKSRLVKVPRRYSHFMTQGYLLTVCSQWGLRFESSQLPIKWPGIRAAQDGAGVGHDERSPPGENAAIRSPLQKK